MAKTVKKSKRAILVAIDLTKESVLALKQALLLKKKLQVPLSIIHVIHMDSLDQLFEKVDKKQYLQNTQQQLTKVYKKVLKASEIKQIKVVFGDPHEVILSTINKIKPQLLVTGDHNRSEFRKFFVGSVAESMVQHSKVPVWVHRSKTAKLPKKVLIAVNLTKFSENGVHLGLSLSKLLGAKATLVHIGEPKHPPAKSFQYHVTYSQQKLEEEKKRFIEYFKKSKRTYPDIKAIFIKGNVADKLTQLATTKRADLLVMSTHGRSGIKLAVLGSVTRKVLHYSAIPLLAVHPK